MSYTGMIGLCGPLFVLLLCFVAVSCTETTTNFNAPADQIQPATGSEAANYRERAVDEFGSRVSKLVVGDLPRRAQKTIRRALKAIRNELRRDDYEPSKVARGFAFLFKAIEKATAQKGAHLVTVLRLKQKKTLRRLLRLLQRANRDGEDEEDREKVGRYLDLISEKRQRFRNDFENSFESTRKNLGEALSDLVAVIHSIKLPITPDWKDKLEHGHEIVIRRLDSARKVLENEDESIGKILSRTTLVVKQKGGRGLKLSAPESESESESSDPEETPIAKLQARFEKNTRRGSDLISKVTGLKGASNRGVGGLNFAFQLPPGDNGNLDDDVNSMDRSEEEDQRRRLRLLEGKKLEWNFDVEDPATEVTVHGSSEEEEPAPDVVGRLLQAQKGMDRITKVHERQMSRLLHELIMSGMVTHSKLIRFVNRFEFSHDRRQHRLGKRLRRVIDIRRAQRILHERRLFALNRERQEDTFLYNRLILRSIQSLGIHELSVELGKRKWGRKYLRSQVVKNLVRQNKLSALAKIQNLYRLKHELQVRNKLKRSQQRNALRRVARATGIPLSALPQLPLLKPGGGLILSLRKKTGRGARRGGDDDDGDDDDDDAVANDDDDDAPNYEEMFNEEGEQEGAEAEAQHYQEDDEDENNNNEDDDQNNDNSNNSNNSKTDSEQEQEHLDLEEVVDFIRKARRNQEELLARHRNYVKDLKRELKEQRNDEFEELNNIQDDDELFDALIDLSRKEKRRQEREIDRYEQMIEELKVDLQDQLEDIQRTEEYVCGLDSFTGRCPKRPEPEETEDDGPSCDRYHGYGGYLLEFLNNLYELRKTHREERMKLINKLSNLEKEAEEEPQKEKKEKKDEDEEDPYAALEQTGGRRERRPRRGRRSNSVAIAGPSTTHTYEVVGLNYEEDDDEEEENNNSNGDRDDDDDVQESEEEEQEIVSVNELIRLLRGLVYFSIDEEKKERDFIKRVLTRHERIHDLIMTLVERYHYDWVKLFQDDDSDLSDEEKMREGIRDLVKLFRLARAFARKSKRDEIELIDRITDRREELQLRVEEVEKAFEAWQNYYGAVNDKVEGLLGVVVNKQAEQENAELEIMKILDARREEEEEEEEAVLAALHRFRKGKYDERSEKRSFKLLIFKKNKK